MSNRGRAVEEAVILAAGMGSRLPSGEVPKPLVKIGGKRLIERTIGNLAKAGIRRAIVVVGFQREELTRALGNVDVPGMELDAVVNEKWRDPNGLSLYAARDAVRGEAFVLTMADHLFDHTIINDLITTGTPEQGVCLAVDTDVESIFDLDDATKVLAEDGLIRRIGKEITDYNAIDTGLFLCSRGVFSSLEEAFEGGGQSLSDGMKILAGRDRLACMPVDGRYWQDVDDEAMFEKAEQDILDGKLA